MRNLVIGQFRSSLFFFFQILDDALHSFGLVPQIGLSFLFFLCVFGYCHERFPIIQKKKVAYFDGDLIMDLAMV